MLMNESYSKVLMSIFISLINACERLFPFFICFIIIKVKIISKTILKVISRSFVWARRQQWH